MITINKLKVEVAHFPDGTQCIKFPHNSTYGSQCVISWFYDSDEEIFTLASVVEYVRRMANKTVSLLLHIPYLPNARMDRIKNPSENFSLKVFANIINSLNFDKVEVQNVHSNVSEALINNIVNFLPERDVQRLLKTCKPDVIFFPDEGACKRYSDMNTIKESGLPIAFGIKKRDWKTGKILGLDIVSDTDLKDKKVLIVDDICSAGGTFKFSAIKLREMGANDVVLYVTHCEDNIQNGDLLKTDLISKIFTTDSILHIEHEKIECIQKFRTEVYN